MSLGEFEFIERLLKPLAAGLPGAFALEDDAAVLPLPADRDLVVTKDAMVAGVHFLEDDPADLVAGKLLRVNLSDLAAMGADPLAYLTAIARPASVEDRYLKGLAAGFARDQDVFGLHLAGGDTVSTTGPLVLSLTALGTVPKGAALRRRGARPGDLVVVSGTLGDAALGLRLRRGLAAVEEAAIPLIERYRTPQPRLNLGRTLRGLATAAIDVSDGLLADLGHVLACSGVGATVEAARIPLSAAGRGLPDALGSALVGGDDYELLFTLPPEHRGTLERISAALELPLTVIGTITAEKDLRAVDAEGRPLPVDRRPGWRHF